MKKSIIARLADATAWTNWEGPGAPQSIVWSLWLFDFTTLRNTILSQMREEVEEEFNV